MSKDCAEINNTLEQNIEWLRALNSKMRTLYGEIGKLTDLFRAESLRKLVVLQERWHAKECSAASIGLSKADIERKRTHYIVKLRMAIRIYTELYEKSAEEVRSADSNAQKLRTSMNALKTLSVEQTTGLEARLQQYDNELMKLEKTYPWLKDPQMNLIEIKEIFDRLRVAWKSLKSMRDMLDKYQQLSTDIVTAKDQLRSTELEYKKLLNQLP